MTLKRRIIKDQQRTIDELRTDVWNAHSAKWDVDLDVKRLVAVHELGDHPPELLDLADQGAAAQLLVPLLAGQRPHVAAQGVDGLLLVAD